MEDNPTKKFSCTRAGVSDATDRRTHKRHRNPSEHPPPSPCCHQQKATPQRTRGSRKKEGKEEKRRVSLQPYIIHFLLSLLYFCWKVLLSHLGRGWGMGLRLMFVQLEQEQQLGLERRHINDLPSLLSSSSLSSFHRDLSLEQRRKHTWSLRAAWAFECWFFGTKKQKKRDVPKLFCKILYFSPFPTFCQIGTPTSFQRRLPASVLFATLALSYLASLPPLQSG